MGLIQTVVLDNGIVVESAYIRVESYAGLKGAATLEFGIYASKDLQRDGKPAIKTKSFAFAPSFEEASPNLLRQGYLSAKANDPFFADATDDLED